MSFHSLTKSSINSSINSFILHSCFIYVLPFPHSLIHWFIHSFVHSFVRSFICALVWSFIHLCFLFHSVSFLGVHCPLLYSFFLNYSFFFVLSMSFIFFHLFWLLVCFFKPFETFSLLLLGYESESRGKLVQRIEDMLDLSPLTLRCLSSKSYIGTYFLSMSVMQSRTRLVLSS